MIFEFCKTPIKARTQATMLFVLLSFVVWFNSFVNISSAAADGVFRDCEKVCPEMVRIPGGSFLMGLSDVSVYGDDAEQREYGRWQMPQHKVELKQGFSIGKYEVSISQWNECVAAGACKARLADQTSFRRDDTPEKFAVDNVSWFDASDYTKWLSTLTGQKYRLPTEAEWEYAARAGTTSLYFWGDDIGQGNVACAQCDFGPLNPNMMPIGYYKPNAFGLFDMLGGVPEWVEDCFHVGYDGAPRDGSIFAGGDCDQRVARGGRDRAGAMFLFSSFREATNTKNRIFGFRVVREIEAAGR